MDKGVWLEDVGDDTIGSCSMLTELGEVQSGSIMTGKGKESGVLETGSSRTKFDGIGLEKPEAL